MGLQASVRPYRVWLIMILFSGVSIYVLWPYGQTVQEDPTADEGLPLRPVVSLPPQRPASKATVLQALAQDRHERAATALAESAAKHDDPEAPPSSSGALHPQEGPQELVAAKVPWALKKSQRPVYTAFVLQRPALMAVVWESDVFW